MSLSGSDRHSLQTPDRRRTSKRRCGDCSHAGTTERLLRCCRTGALARPIQPVIRPTRWHARWTVHPPSSPTHPDQSTYHRRSAPPSAPPGAEVIWTAARTFASRGGFRPRTKTGPMRLALANDAIYQQAAGAAAVVGGAERQQWLLARALAVAGWSVIVGVRND